MVLHRDPAELQLVQEIADDTTGRIPLLETCIPRRRICRNGTVVCAGNHQGEEMKTAALYLFSFAMFTALVWLGVRAF
jgi:hypothetical protein